MTTPFYSKSAAKAKADFLCPTTFPAKNRLKHLSGRDAPLVEVMPLLAMIDDWNAFLKSAMPEGTERHTPARSHWPAAGRRNFPWSSGGNGRPCPQTPETRPKTETKYELSHVSVRREGVCVSVGESPTWEGSLAQ